ncbi:Respiratory supercomplex factor 1, mitochondrial [Coprinopsis cinerea AmutBmut pab1-1]|nr:Respiratory supercomplex factor 1, mitochondrial [Coprinopsis cinerea AmutBmut pab1-1]
MRRPPHVRRQNATGTVKEMNYWMRARVGLQGLTLVALVAGSMALKAAKEKAELEAANAPELTQEQIRQLEKEKEEFEMRLKEAEYSHAQEMALAAGANVRKAKTAEAAQKSAAVGVEVDTENRPSTPAPSGKSWWKMW